MEYNPDDEYHPTQTFVDNILVQYLLKYSENVQINF